MAATGSFASRRPLNIAPRSVEGAQGGAPLQDEREEARGDHARHPAPRASTARCSRSPTLDDAGGWRVGAKIIQAVTLPSSMLQPTRSPVMAPAAMNIGLQESITVRPIHAGPNTRSLRAVIQVPIMKGRASVHERQGRPPELATSREQARPSPGPAPKRMPLSPTEWSARSVSAAAIRSGKRSCSMLIICRLIGMPWSPRAPTGRNPRGMAGRDMVRLIE